MDLSTEDEEFQRANEAYMDKFDPPLVTAIRGLTKETLLEDAESQLKHKKEQDLFISVVEAVKIANHRLPNMVEESLIGTRN